MFRPKQKRARFTKGEEGKLLRTFPDVLSPKVRKPDRAMKRHARREIVVDMWVRRLKRVRVGTEREE